MIEAIKEVLKGIDQTELESTDGWWETSAGAEFGAKKLKYILGLLAQPAQQEPVNAWLIFGKDNEPLIVSSDWVITKKYKEAGRRVEQLAYYTTPPQLEERNFCPRCGKRTADLTVIHTCTPPQERT
jgi:hypothetical protein